MADFKFVEFPEHNVDHCSSPWVIFATGRIKRPHMKSNRDFCPFCPGNEKHGEEVYRVDTGTEEKDWQVRVIENKFPFAPVHEVVVHSPKHTASLADMPIEHGKLVLETFVNRYNTHRDRGSVVVFGNAGKAAGESIYHPHSQIAVVPKEVDIAIPKLEADINYYGQHLEIRDFVLVCPPYSQWPDEVWIVPQRRNVKFGQVMVEEIDNLTFILKRLLQLFTIRQGEDFPYNFYIYPYNDWYFRLIPRAKRMGGFELATGIFVNTQDPRETMAFLKEYFFEEDEEKIKPHVAAYRKGV